MTTKKQNKNPPLYVVLPEDLRARLDKQVDVERRTLAAVVMVAIEQYLAKAPVGR